MSINKYDIPAPSFEKIFRVEIMLGDVYPLGETGKGYSEIVEVTGGSFEGKISGTVVSLGADWGLLYDEDINAMDNRIVLKTDDDCYIRMDCSGRLILSQEAMMKGAEGEEVSPYSYYFRQNVELTAGTEKYSWVNRSVFFSSAMITPEGNVCLDVYKLC